VHTKLGWENLEQRDDLADLGVDGGIILNAYSALWQITDWTHLAQVRHHWLAVVTLETILRVPKDNGEISKQLLASEE